MLSTILAQTSPVQGPTSGGTTGGTSGGGAFTLKPFEDILGTLTNFIDALVPIIFAVAFIVFIWGMFRYFIAGGADEEKRKQGRDLAIWGIVAMAIMFSVWGLVKIVTNTIPGDKTRPNIPTFKTSEIELPPQVVHIS